MTPHVVMTDYEERHTDLLPLSFTRPTADLRVGIDTIRQKWEAALPASYSYLPAPYLREKFPAKEDPEDSTYICGTVLPDDSLVEAIRCLAHGQALFCGDEFLAFHGSRQAWEERRFDKVAYEGPEPVVIRYLFDLFLQNGDAIRRDFVRFTKGRDSRPLHTSNTVIGDYRLPDGLPAIFIEEGASVLGAVLNVTDGPIYIGKDAEIMEGSCVRGPFALCEHARINMGSKVYGATTVGPFCKVGGEINNVVFTGYSNKAHDGFLGNAVIGEWCNIGAGTNASNLKNDYSNIRIWNYRSRTFMRTGLQFCGLMMGDHSKAGINCMFNTATVIGVGCNIHGAGFPRVFVPSFSEGSPTAGFSDVSLKKFFDIAARVMVRRNIELTEADKSIFEKVYEYASSLKR